MSQNHINNEAHNQIEDIIESRNDIGQYGVLCNGLKQPNMMPPPPNTRYAYSNPGNSRTEDIRDNVSTRNVEGNMDLRYLDVGNNTIGPTDSEITLCRVKQENSHVKKSKVNNWDVMHDTAIPGDGTHLGDSPSMVNLVTFVVQADGGRRAHGKCMEFMVPLSSWEPTQTAPINPQSTTIINTIIEQPSADSMAMPTSSTNNEIIQREPTGTLQDDAEGNRIDSEQACPASDSVRSANKPKKTTSLKDLLKRMVFWRRKSRESISNNNNMT